MQYLTTAHYELRMSKELVRVDSTGEYRYWNTKCPFGVATERDTDFVTAQIREIEGLWYVSVRVSDYKGTQRRSATLVPVKSLEDAENALFQYAGYGYAYSIRFKYSEEWLDTTKYPL